jgi:transcription initiation factor TFIIIB Brf1 subunit/transcription initiation factor TFIIB
MERCPTCRKMTYEYDYTKQDWVCVSYDCGAEGRECGGPPHREMQDKSGQAQGNRRKESSFRV